MSRSLNIERRRKRIRHYHARRRQRSHVHRAFTYWWSTVCLLAFVFFALVSTCLGVFPRMVKEPADFTLPKCGLRLVTVSEAEYHAQMYAEQMVPEKERLTDEDVGISLTSPVLEPRALTHAPLDTLVLPEKKIHFDVLASTLPAMVPAKPMVLPEVSTVNYHTSQTLAAVRFRPVFEGLPIEENGEARFYIVLNEKGKPVDVIRFAPTGVESPTHAAIRRALLATKGKRQAEGTITVQWKKGVKE